MSDRPDFQRGGILPAGTTPVRLPAGEEVLTRAEWERRMRRHRHAGLRLLDRIIRRRRP